MCGICGIFSFNDSVVLQRDLQLMTDSIAHRGPDGEGFWINKNSSLGFGHRRLSIIDLSDGGKQPMHYAEGRFTITFNGEIYNYKELKHELINAGYQFKTESDTEVLLALYHQKREKCLEDLDGMFAFAIWDEQEQQLFCARDRFGEKPFFIHNKNNRFVFASEIKAFWALGIQKECSLSQLFNFVALGHLFEPNNRAATFYEGITKLEAGHYVVIDNTGNIKNEKYWSINPALKNNSISFEDACSELNSLFTDSLIKRLRSDVPVGSSLSGGLDSSLIVCMIDKLNTNNKFSQSTFSARFKNFDKDEGAYMELVNNIVNAKTHYVFADEEVFMSSFDKMVYHIEEPFATPSVVAQYAVMQLAKENNVTVLLDGQGADELLAGYSYMYYNYFSEIANKNPFRFIKQKKVYDALHASSFNAGKLFWLYAFMPNLFTASSKVKQNARLANNSFLNKDFMACHINTAFEVNQTPVNNLNLNLLDSINSGQLEDLLKYADRNSMAHSREIRLPFLNHKLAEFLFTLPTSFKVNKGYSKYIMRKTFESILPAQICWRKDKIGYETPQEKWMANKKIKEKMVAELQTIQKQGIINQNLIDSVTGMDKAVINSTEVFRCWVASKLINQ